MCFSLLSTFYFIFPLLVSHLSTRTMLLYIEMFVRRNEINEKFHTTRSVIELEIAKVRHKFRPTGADTFSCNKLNFSLVRFFSPLQFSPLLSRAALRSFHVQYIILASLKSLACACLTSRPYCVLSIPGELCTSSSYDLVQLNMIISGWLVVVVWWRRQSTFVTTDDVNDEYVALKSEEVKWVLGRFSEERENFSAHWEELRKKLNRASKLLIQLEATWRRELRVSEWVKVGEMWVCSVFSFPFLFSLLLNTLFLLFILLPLILPSFPVAHSLSGWNFFNLNNFLWKFEKFCRSRAGKEAFSSRRLCPTLLLLQ